MAQAAIAAQIHQPLDVHGDVAPQIAFDRIVAVDGLADLQHLRVGQLVDTALLRYACLGADILGELRPDAVDVLEGNDHALLRRDVYACDASHISLPGTAPWNLAVIARRLDVSRI